MRLFVPNTSVRWDGRGWGAGYSLVELLSVLAVIGALTSLLFPAFTRARESGRATVCRNNLRQLSLALQVYAGDYRETLPWPGEANRNAEPDWVWGGHSLAQLALAAAWQRSNFGFHAEAGSLFPYVTGQTREPLNPRKPMAFPTYRCPSSGKLGEALRVNYSLNGRFDPGVHEVESEGVKLSRISHLSSKVAFVNEDPRVMRDAAFEPSGTAANGIFVRHHGRAIFAFLDGHLENFRDQGLRAVQLIPRSDELFSAYR